MLYSDAPQVELKMFSFLIKNITKNSKKQFRNAHSMVITARIISYNLKVDWSLQNKCESRIKVDTVWASKPEIPDPNSRNYLRNCRLTAVLTRPANV